MDFEKATILRGNIIFEEFFQLWKLFVRSFCSDIYLKQFAMISDTYCFFPYLFSSRYAFRVEKI